jgi:hypothetical protein
VASQHPPVQALENQFSRINTQSNASSAFEMPKFSISSNVAGDSPVITKDKEKEIPNVKPPT